MKIHLFISEKSPAGDQLISALHATRQKCAVIRHRNFDTLNRVIPDDYQELIVAVVMVASYHELTLLARNVNVWDRFKTLLVLPDTEPEILNLSHDLRPIYITYMDSDFGVLVSILDHCLQRSEGSNSNEGSTSNS